MNMNAITEKGMSEVYIWYIFSIIFIYASINLSIKLYSRNNYIHN